MINRETLENAIDYMDNVADPSLEVWSTDEGWALTESVPLIAAYGFKNGFDPVAIGIGVRMGYLAQRFALGAATDDNEDSAGDEPTAEDVDWFNKQRLGKDE